MSYDDLDLEKEVTKLEKKLTKSEGPDFTSNIRNLDREGLNKKLLDLAKYNEEITNTQKLDLELEEAEKRVKVLKSPYNIDKRVNKEKRRFVKLVMEEKGFE